MPHLRKADVPATSPRRPNPVDTCKQQQSPVGTFHIMTAPTPMATMYLRRGAAVMSANPLPKLMAPFGRLQWISMRWSGQGTYSTAICGFRTPNLVPDGHLIQDEDSVTEFRV